MKQSIKLKSMLVILASFIFVNSAFAAKKVTYSTGTSVSTVCHDAIIKVFSMANTMAPAGTYSDGLYGMYPVKIQMEGRQPRDVILVWIGLTNETGTGVAGFFLPYTDSRSECKIGKPVASIFQPKPNIIDLINAMSAYEKVAKGKNLSFEIK